MAAVQHMPMYTDSLPPNALSNVLRFFSDRPRDPNWRNKFGIKKLRDISRTIGPLKELAQEQITQLNLESGEVESEEVWDKNVSEVCTTFGTSCSAVRFHLYFANASGTSSNLWLQSFIQNCTNVKKLEIWADRNVFPLREVLVALQGKLEELRLEATRHQEAYFSSIADHCTGLKRFHVQLCSRNHTTLRSAFETIGPSLQTLSIFIVKTWTGTLQSTAALSIKDIGRWCPNVRDLQVYGDTEDYRRDVEDVCIGYGGHLQRLSFPYCGKNVQFLSELAKNCPNASVETGMNALGGTIDDFLYGEKKDPTKTMDILGPLLSAFHFRCGFTMTPEFGSAVSKCTNLSDLDISECTPDVHIMLQDIFEQPKPHLMNLRITLKKPIASSFQESFCDVLSTIARNSGSLQLIVLSCPYRHSRSLEMLARANNHLEFVNICLLSDGEYPGNSEQARRDALVGVVESFSACSRLQNLFIYDDCQENEEKIEAVEKACFKIRSRLVSVSVRGLWYLQ